MRRVIEVNYPEELKRVAAEVKEKDVELQTLAHALGAQLVSELCSGMHGKGIAYKKWLN